MKELAHSAGARGLGWPICRATLVKGAVAFWFGFQTVCCGDFCDCKGRVCGQGLSVTRKVRSLVKADQVEGRPPENDTFQ